MTLLIILFLKCRSRPLARLADAEDFPTRSRCSPNPAPPVGCPFPPPTLWRQVIGE